MIYYVTNCSTRMFIEREATVKIELLMKGQISYWAIKAKCIKVYNYRLSTYAQCLATETW